MHSTNNLTVVIALAALFNLACGFSIFPRVVPTHTSLNTKSSHLFYRNENDNNDIILHEKNIAVTAPSPVIPTSFFNNGVLMVDDIAASTATNELLPASRLNDHVAIPVTAHRDETAKPTAAISAADGLASFWGAFGVIYILMKAVVRVAPIAMEPFSNGSASIPLTPFQLGAYISTCLFFAYAEGYKGFQRKFSPLVVARSFTLRPTSSLFKIHHTILAPLYSMGLFYATKKRMIVSWSVSIGVGIIVHAVKKLPYPYRNIVDAGVVVGLSWGAASIAIGYLQTVLNGGIAKADPAMPKRI